MTENKTNRKKIITIAAIAIAAIGVYIFIQRWFDSRYHNYYAFYNNVKGLQASSPVQLNGVRIGKIANIDLNGRDHVKVTIAITKDIELAEGTVALLVSSGLMGDKSIKLVPGPGPGTIVDNAVIPTAFDTSVMPSSVQITPYLETAKSYLRSTDSTLRAFNIVIQTGFEAKAIRALVSFEAKNKYYATLTNQISNKIVDLTGTIHSADAMIKDIASKDIKTTIDSADSKTARLSRTDIRGNITSIQNSIRRIKSDINATNSDTGLGKHINSKDAYNNAVANTGRMDSSMKQLHKHPTGFTLLGKKKKKK